MVPSSFIATSLSAFTAGIAAIILRVLGSVREKSFYFLGLGVIGVKACDGKNFVEEQCIT